jgi:hypothetical protein
MIATTFCFSVLTDKYHRCQHSSFPSSYFTDYVMLVLSSSKKLRFVLYILLPANRSHSRVKLKDLPVIINFG